MGRPGPQTQAKRLRESKKKDKRRAKDERRAARKAAKTATASAPTPQIDSQADVTEPDRLATHSTGQD